MKKQRMSLDQFALKSKQLSDYAQKKVIGGADIIGATNIDMGFTDDD